MPDDNSHVGYAGDPLTEPTRALRLDAARRKAGLTVTEFSRRIGVRWQTVQSWTAEGRVPQLDVFVKACEVVGYSMLDIVYGYERPNSPRILGAEGIRRLFAELNTPPEIRAQFARHQDSPEGRFADYSRAYVTAWLGTFEAAIHKGNPIQRAHELAGQAAERAHALALAVAARVQPIETRDLAEAIEAERPTPPRKRKGTGDHSTRERAPSARAARR